jgi:ribonuclease HI
VRRTGKYASAQSFLFLASTKNFSLPGWHWQAGGQVLTEVEIFCDGACSGNPGPGGYGTIMRCRGVEKELSGGAAETTNNRMELSGAIAGLKELSRRCNVTVTTDSQYLVKGMTEWLAGWQKNGWRNSKKEPVLNRDLWEELAGLAGKHAINWQWVRGHAGHIENERCDALAREAIEAFRREVK